MKKQGVSGLQAVILSCRPKASTHASRILTQKPASFRKIPVRVRDTSKDGISMSTASLVRHSSIAVAKEIPTVSSLKKIAS